MEAPFKAPHIPLSSPLKSTNIPAIREAKKKKERKNKTKKETEKERGSDGKKMARSGTITVVNRWRCSNKRNVARREQPAAHFVAAIIMNQLANGQRGRNASG